MIRTELTWGIYAPKEVPVGDKGAPSPKVDQQCIRYGVIGRNTD